MKFAIGPLVVMLSLLGTSHAYAQNAMAGPGTVEVALIPGGTTFFTSTDTEPSFANYSLGGSLTYNITRFVGVEGEVGGTLGVSQNLKVGQVNGTVKTPNIATYSANVILSTPTGSSAVPYLTGGVGGLTLFETPALGINKVETLLTGNIGGGVKWYANRRWGVRVDYRFLAVQSKDTAPAFFGQVTRYGHRVYGAIILNLAS
jgi:opacity protein-like surface antigen